MSENYYCYQVYKDIQYLVSICRFDPIPFPVARYAQKVRERISFNIKMGKAVSNAQGENFYSQMLHDKHIIYAIEKRAIMEKSAHRKNKTKRGY